jgi:hypothetical protein
MSQGYLLVALGKQYIDECVLLVNTIRKQGDTRPVSLLIHSDDTIYASKTEMFDQLVHFSPQGDIWNECQTGFEKFCLYPRLYFNDYLVYDETIIVDSDVLCQAPTDNLWKYLTEQPMPVIMLGRHDDPNWHWGSIREVSEAFGKHVPHVHGGFFYLRKGLNTGKFFSVAKMMFYSYDDFKCKRAFRGGRVDEIIFALTHSFLNVMPVEFDDVPAMSFNYEPHIQIPSKLQTEGGQNVEMSDYIPFIHMFDKMGGANFTALYDKIMNGV